MHHSAKINVDPLPVGLSPGICPWPYLLGLASCAWDVLWHHHLSFLFLCFFNPPSTPLAVTIDIPLLSPSLSPRAIMPPLLTKLFLRDRGSNTTQDHFPTRQLFVLGTSSRRPQARKWNAFAERTHN